MEEAIAAVRSFSRFYTKLVGALDACFLETGLSLPEARLLYEIANVDEPLASALQKRLGMDAGYVSRLLRRFEERGWLARSTSSDDARQRRIKLTRPGRDAYRLVNTRQRAAVRAMVEDLSTSQQVDLVAALGAARALLEARRDCEFAVRTVRTGDLPLIASRQALLYRDAYGWGRGLEANVTETVLGFLRNQQAGRSEGWVGEVEGALAGSVLLTDEGGELARLRLLYVEPWARGLGLGEALVTTCIAFAREAGYRAMTLWTHAPLESARRIYAAHGFQLTDTAIHHEFGVPVQGETWRLELARAA